jgi:photosystem II stability/assembly factor-like uncharacterized protein
MPGGGVWRSADFASLNPTYVPLTDHLPGIPAARRVGLNIVSTLAVDPVHPRSIYGRAGGSPAELLKSTDGGDTWGLVGGGKFGMASGIWRVLVDQQADVYVAFNSGGFWQSGDGGQTWTNVATKPLNGVEFHDAVYFVQQSGEIDIYVGVIDRQGKDRSGVWRFAAGQWTQMPMTLTNMRGQGFARAAINHITLSADPAGGVVASLSQADDNKAMVGLLNVFKLVGQTWQPQWFSQTDWFGTQSGYVQGVCIAPDGRIYAGGIGLAQSAGGQAFVPIGTDSNGNSIHVDQHVVVAHDGHIYVGTDGGLFRFRPHLDRPGVDAWEHLNGPSLTNFLSTGASLHPTDPSVVLVGNQDNGIARRSGLGLWASAKFSNEREKLRFDPDPKLKGKFAYSGDPNNGFYWSQDDGVTFAGFQPKGVPAPDPPPPFAMHPNDTARILVGWMNLYETPDRGTTWNNLLTLQTSPSALTYTAGQSAYVAAGAQLFQSFDDGKTWAADPFDFGNAIVSVSADASHPEAICVATSRQVFRRTSPNVNWEDLTGNLALRINVMTLLPGLEWADDPWLFVGTEAGVFTAAGLKGANTVDTIRRGAARRLRPRPRRHAGHTGPDRRDLGPWQLGHRG